MRANRFLFGLTATITAIGTAVALGLPANATTNQVRSTAGASEVEMGDTPDAPGEYIYRQQTVAGQNLPAGAFATAANEAAKLPITGGTWSAKGPTNIGGRVTGLAVDPTRPNTIYAASASGGVWVSTDAGGTFKPVWPDQQTQAVGAIAVAPDGTVYVGTGETNPGGGSLTYEGTGVYRSTDHGAHWRRVGLPDSGTIGQIVVDPKHPKTVWVAVSGSLFNAGGQRGVYRSTDGGQNWQRVLAPETDYSGATGVQLDPSNPKRIYAVMWDHRRQPQGRTYGGTGSGVFRSDDGGVSWKRLGGGVFGPDAGIGRIGLGQAPSDPNRLYAVVTKTSGYFDAAYTSTDGGDSWTQLPANKQLSDSQSSYGWWFSRVWVDPHDPLHIFVPGIQLMHSADGGKTWTATSDAVVHGDHHDVVWDPRKPGRVYDGNDGGVYRSERNGEGGDQEWVHATVEPWTQFYTVATTPQDRSRISGGAQDIGDIRSWGPNGYDNYYPDGDGTDNLINQTNKSNVFACFQYGYCARSTNGGNTMTDLNIPADSDRCGWLAPLVFDPSDPNVMYQGCQFIRRSTDNGRTWTQISDDLTGGPGTDGYPYGTLTAIAVAKSDQKTIWVGTDDGRIWLTHDSGAHWTKVLDGQPWVTSIVVDAKDPATAYLTLSGYRSGSNQPHVLRTHDSGAHWTDLSGNLPQAPVNHIAIGAAGHLYVATDQGVFVSDSNGRWSRYGRGLPLSPIDDISYDATNHRITAATFGRGFYQIPAS